MGIGEVSSEGAGPIQQENFDSVLPPSGRVEYVMVCLCSTRPEHQRASRPDAGPELRQRLHGRGAEAAAGRRPADAAAARQKGGEQPDGGAEVLLITTATGSEHRVQERVVLRQRGTLVEEDRYVT